MSNRPHACALIGALALSSACTFTPRELPGAPGDEDPILAAVVVTPGLLVDTVENGLPVEPRVYAVSVARSDGAPLAAATFAPSVPWLGASSTGPGVAPGSLAVDVSITPAELGWGLHTAEIVVHDADDASAAPGVLVVRVAVTFTPAVNSRTTVHAGPTAGGCPRTTEGGAMSACDFSGARALVEAAQAAEARFTSGGGKTTIVAYGTGTAEPAIYDGDIVLRGAHLVGAPGQRPEDVEIFCSPDALGSTAGVRVRSRDLAIQRVSFLLDRGCPSAILAWDSENLRGTPPEGLLVDGVVIAALRPEIFGTNSIEQPFHFGDRTVMRNSYVYGYVELAVDLRSAADLRFVNNTFAPYQSANGPAFDVSGAQRVIIANNVVLMLTGPSQPWVAADTPGTEVVVADNAVFGHAAPVGLPDGAVTGTTSAREHLVSPLSPRVKDGSTLRAGSRARDSGLSVDGVELATLDALRPGAFQLTAPARPREAVHVGAGANACGGACDFTQLDDNEIQKAVWSAWPSQSVVVHAASAPYAGNANISWPVTIAGATAAVSGATLVFRREDPRLIRGNTWPSSVVLRSLVRNAGATRIEGLRVLLDADVAFDAAIVLEASGTEDNVPSARSVLRRVHVDALTATRVPDFGVVAYDAVVLQDVLVHGPFDACVSFTSLPEWRSTVLSPTDVSVANVTCRLSDPSGLRGTRSYFGAFNVPGIQDGEFFSIVAQAGPAPVFCKAVPIGFTAVGGSLRARNLVATAGYLADSNVTVNQSDLVMVASALSPLFVSDTDSRLDLSAENLAHDASSAATSFSGVFAEGRDLDGAVRPASGVDCGAYEQ